MFFYLNLFIYKRYQLYFLMLGLLNRLDQLSQCKWLNPPAQPSLRQTPGPYQPCPPGES